MQEDILRLLEQTGIKPTSNRITILRALSKAQSPMSLIDLEIELETLERSSIFRVLTLLAEKNIVHQIEDGKGITRYEVCKYHYDSQLNNDKNPNSESGLDVDTHPHFYCEKCHKVICLEECKLMIPSLPEGYEVKSLNYMLKGICANCNK